MRASEQAISLDPLLVIVSPLATRDLIDNVFKACDNFANSITNQKEAGKDSPLRGIFNEDRFNMQIESDNFQDLFKGIAGALGDFFKFQGITSNWETSKGLNYSLKYLGSTQEFDLAPILKAAVSYGLRKESLLELEKEEAGLMKALKTIVLEVCTWVSKKTLERKLDNAIKQSKDLHEKGVEAEINSGRQQSLHTR